jgi:hypothetical protein
MVTNEMKNKINIDDFLILIYWVQTFFVFEGKTFKHKNLIDQAESYKIKNIPLDTSIHNIDELVIDSYQVYVKIKASEKSVNEILDTVQLPFITKDMVIEQTQKYESIFEDLMENYRYEDTEIRGIQKGFLQEKMNKYVEVEEYENAARMRDIIKEC